jgi:hypothetical protein
MPFQDTLLFILQRTDMPASLDEATPAPITFGNGRAWTVLEPGPIPDERFVFGSPVPIKALREVLERYAGMALLPRDALVCRRHWEGVLLGHDDARGTFLVRVWFDPDGRVTSMVTIDRRT